jgi:hypothetical protein
MLVLHAPDGHRRALGSLGDFATEKEACEYAVKYGRTAVDKHHYKKASATRNAVADSTGKDAREVAPFVRTVFSIFKWSAGRSRCRFYRGQHREVSFVRGSNIET